MPWGALTDEIRGRMCASVGDVGRLTVGVEIEVIPVHGDDGRRVLLEDEAGAPGGIRLLRTAGEGRGWRSEATAYGTPRFVVPRVGWITFEPGGQLELSTAPFASVDALSGAVEDTLRAIHAAAERLGIVLVARGIDPVNDADHAPLLVTSERFRKQAAHYAMLGPWGRRMMRQSAAIHVNLDLGGRPLRRWSVANRLAPALTALFANSPRYAGAETGCRSFRAEQWRHLDPSRTGTIDEDRDPVSAYTRFALGALDFLGPPEGIPARPFRDRWCDGAGLDAWRDHLSTLFPEVRPRGYLEVRTVDALRPAWIPVPVLILCGILYDGAALEEAERLLPPATPEALRAAGRQGSAHPRLGALARDVFDLGVEGARRLGTEVVGGALLELAGAYRERFVARGEDPGHEADPADPFAV